MPLLTRRLHECTYLYLQGGTWKSETYIIYAYISPELQIQTSPNVLCMLPMALGQFFSDGVAIRYVLPV